MSTSKLAVWDDPMPIIQSTYATCLLSTGCGRLFGSDYSVVTLKSNLDKEIWLNDVFWRGPLCARAPASFFGAAATGWESPLGGRAVRAVEALLRVVAGLSEAGRCRITGVTDPGYNCRCYLGLSQTLFTRSRRHSSRQTMRLTRANRPKASKISKIAGSSRVQCLHSSCIV